MSVNITRSPLSITRLWNEGQNKLTELGDLKEATKIGTLRGGSVGLVTDHNPPQVVGKCIRLSHLRSLGYQERVSNDKQLMFGAGYQNEDQWLAALAAAWTGKILREEEYPVVWTTANGTKVSGRPDVLLCDDASIPQVGLELKLASSVWTAYDVHYKLEPKLPHLIQAAHYMWKLGIPYKLVYTSRVDWLVPYNIKHKLAHAHDIVVNEKQEPFKIKPFIREYDLELVNGRLYYHTNGMSSGYKTVVTVEGIERYYETLSTMSETKQLGPRPSDLNVAGVKKYNPCNYCPLSQVCDTYEDNYDLWLDNAMVAFSQATETSTEES